MWNAIKREPVAFAGLLTALVTALIGMAIGFGWIDWTDEQVALVLGVWAALVAVLTFLVRGAVTPVTSPPPPE